MSELALIVIGALLFGAAVVAVTLAVRARARNHSPPPADLTYAWGEPHGDFAPVPQEAVAPTATLAPAPAGPAVSVASPGQATGQVTVLEPAPVPPGVAARRFLLKCPACQSQFSVEGVKPIVTNCPGCGKKGILR